MINLTHIDLAPIFYGVVMFLGIAVMRFKLASGRWFSLMTDIGAFSLVFWLHGGTMAGGFAAMVAALLAGLFLPVMARR